MLQSAVNKGSTSTKPNNTSSFGTGAGGDTFQFRIQADFFSIMLINGQFPCLEMGYKAIKWIKMQGRPQFVTDDIDVCVIDLANQERKLLGQIKHKLTFTASDEEYVKTLQQAWDDYTGSNFNPELDVFAIITGLIPSQIAIDTIKPLFNAARASATLAEFNIKTKESKPRHEKFEVIQNIIQKYSTTKGVTATDEDIWRFCKTLHLLSFDHDYSSESLHKANVINRIHTGLKDKSPYSAEAIYYKLLDHIKEWNLSGATRTRENLPSDITSCFRSYQKRFHSLDPWELPLLNARFIGQTLQLKSLYAQIELIEDASPTKTVIIFGTGGIGKTSLATHIAYYSPSTYRLRAWFNADTEEQLNIQYHQFATDLSLIIESDSVDKIKRAVKRWFQQNPGWLIIFDNAKSKTAIESYIPTQGGQALITTRTSKAANSIKIELMSEEDAVALLRRYADPNNDRLLRTSDDDLKVLSEELGGLPLALSQAGSYIYSARVTPKRYLELYTSDKKNMMETRDLEDHEPVYFTWDITVKHIVQLDNKAIELFNIIACYAPDNIPRDLFNKFLSPTQLNKCLTLLAEYSLINLTESTISLHRVLRDVTLEKQREQETHLKYLKDSLTNIMKLFKFNRDDRKSLHYCEKLLPHVIALLALIEEAENVEFETAPINYLVGLFLLDYLQDANKALKYFRNVQATSVNIDEGLRKRICRQLGKTYARLKNDDEAEKLLLQGDLDTVEGLCDVAIFYILRKGYMQHPTLTIEALEYEESISDVEISSGDDNENSLDTTNKKITSVSVEIDKVVNIPSKQKNHEYRTNAKEYLDRARELELSAANTAMVSHLFGTYHLVMNNIFEAKNEYDNALQLKRKYYPSNHYEIARTLQQLGKVILRINKKTVCKNEVEIGIKYLQEALEINIAHYHTKKRIEIVALLFELAKACELQGSRNVAGDYLKEALAIKRSGFKNPSIIWSKLGEMLLKYGFPNEALEITQGCKDNASKKLSEKIDSSSKRIDDYFSSSQESVPKDKQPTTRQSVEFEDLDIPTVEIQSSSFSMFVGSSSSQPLDEKEAEDPQVKLDDLSESYEFNSSNNTAVDSILDYDLDTAALASQRSVVVIDLGSGQQSCKVVPAEPDGDCGFTSTRNSLILQGKPEIAEKFNRNSFIELVSDLHSSNSEDSLMRNSIDAIIRSDRASDIQDWCSRFKSKGCWLSDVHFHLLSMHFNLRFNFYCLSDQNTYVPEPSYESIYNGVDSNKALNIDLAHVSMKMRSGSHSLNHFDTIIIAPLQIQNNHIGTQFKNSPHRHDLMSPINIISPMKINKNSSDQRVDKSQKEILEDLQIENTNLNNYNQREFQSKKTDLIIYSPKRNNKKRKHDEFNADKGLNQEHQSSINKPI